MVTDEAVTLSVAQAAALGERGVQRIGYSADEARVIVAHLIDSELCGYPALGLARVLTIAEHPRTRLPRTSIHTVHETPLSAMLDGGNYVGLYAVHHAARVAIEKARASGCAFVGMHNAFLSGRNAYYLEMIARAGFVGVHMACGAPIVAPHGGTAATFGTNPVAFGLPNKPHPLILDFGTSAVMSGDVILARRLQQLLPSGVAVDAQGEPTRDPAAALAGAILPFGGYKGSGLALIAQAFGLLAGAALPNGRVQDFGFFFVVFDPGLLMPAVEFERQLTELLDKVRATPPQRGFERVRVPSERAFAEREQRRERGISLPQAVYEGLIAL